MMKVLMPVILAVFLLFPGCEKKGLDGKNSLIEMSIEPQGEHCPNGGFKIESGLDLNRNELLDEVEIQQTEYICHGETGSPGLSSHIDVYPLDPADSCESGGYKIVSGIDYNNNDQLDEGEIQRTDYLCNGNNGEDGSQSLIKVNLVGPGEICPGGGYELLSGLDLNANDVLEEAEIRTSTYVCNGSDSPRDRQIRFTLLEIPGTSNNGNENKTEGFYIGRLEKFNKDNWPGVDSAIFVTNIQTTNAAHHAYAELFDLTHHAVIENSTVYTYNTNAVRLTSENFYDNLPEGEVDLTIQLRIENTASTSYISGTSYLFLYRK